MEHAVIVDQAHHRRDRKERAGAPADVRRRHRRPPCDTLRSGVPPGCRCQPQSRHETVCSECKFAVEQRPVFGQAPAMQRALIYAILAHCCFDDQAAARTALLRRLHGGRKPVLQARSLRLRGRCALSALAHRAGLARYAATDRRARVCSMHAGL